jgi:hypothetical protein
MWDPREHPLRTIDSQVALFHHLQKVLPYHHLGELGLGTPCEVVSPNTSTPSTAEIAWIVDVEVTWRLMTWDPRERPLRTIDSRVFYSVTSKKCCHIIISGK